MLSVCCRKLFPLHFEVLRHCVHLAYEEQTLSGVVWHPYIASYVNKHVTLDFECGVGVVGARSEIPRLAPVSKMVDFHLRILDHLVNLGW